MNCRDLSDLRSAAVKAFTELPMGARIQGCEKPMTQDDLRLLAIYDAALQIINRKGGLKDGWLEKNPIEFLEDDSLPKEDDYL